MNERVEIEFHCTQLPGGERFLALQQADAYVQVVSANLDSALFRFPVTLRRHKGSGDWDFGGDCVKGTAGERFVYLCWCLQEGERFVMQGRVKVPLYVIPQDQITHALEHQTPLIASLILTNAKGLPVTGTIKPLSLLWEV